MNVRAAALAALFACPAIASAEAALAPAAPAAQAEPPAVPVAPLEAEPPEGVRAPAAVEPPASRPAAPRWTLGAGVQAFASDALGSVGGLSPLLTVEPVATAFVERRVGERIWLVFSAFGSVSRDVDEGVFVSPPGDGDVIYTSASVGLRRVVTRPGAVVDVSLVGTVGGGYLRSRWWSEVDTGRELREETGTFVNASGGVALERALTEALALRISTPIIVAWRSRTERADTAPTRESTSTGAAVTLAPRLELRLAF